MVIVVKNDGTISLINCIITTCIRMSDSIINGYVFPINRDVLWLSFPISIIIFAFPFISVDRYFCRKDYRRINVHRYSPFGKLSLRIC